MREGGKEGGTGEEEESKDRRGEDDGGRGLGMSEMKWGGGRE